MRQSQFLIPTLKEDPADAEGSDDENLAVFRNVRDQIKARIKTWLNENAS